VTDLLPMDYRCLAYLVEHGGRVPYSGIPSRIFAGAITETTPNLVELGLVLHKKQHVYITEAGRSALADHLQFSWEVCRSAGM
jgi:hypothetical protein